MSDELSKDDLLESAFGFHDALVAYAYALLRDLQEVEKVNGSLLDNTMVLYGCHMGDANIHNNANLPIRLAGGGFDHGQHLAFNSTHNQPLCNVFVTCFRRWVLRPTDLEAAKGR